MITLKYSQVSSFEFQKAFQKMATTSMPTKWSYAVKKIADRIHQEKKVISEAYVKELVEKFAKRDASGSIVREQGPDSFDIDDAKMEEFKKAQEEFGERTFQVEREPLPLEWLDGAKLSAAELTALDGVYTDAPVVPAAQNVVNLK